MSNRLDEQALLKAVCDSPEDDLPRLAYADWLDENGVPGAFLIRFGMESPTCGASGYDADVLVERFVLAACTLKGQPDGLVETYRMGKLSAQIADGCTFQRGFVEAVTVSANHWLRYGKKLAETMPLKTVALAGAIPYYLPSQGPYFTWGCYPAHGGESAVPAPIYRALDGAPKHGYDGPQYATSSEAIAALSAACLKWAREKA